MKKKIGVFGNCQGRVILAALKSALPENSTYDVIFVRNFGARAEEIFNNNLSENDILLIQRSSNPPPEYVKKIKNRIEYPNLQFSAFWPQIATHPQNDFPKYAPKGLWENSIGDRSLNSLMASGGNTEAILNEYLSLDFATLFPLDRLAQLQIGMSKKLDATCGTRVTEFLEENWQNRLFHKPLYPGSLIYQPILEKLFSDLSEILDQKKMELVLSDLLFFDGLMSNTQSIVHPSVVDFYKLKGYDEDARFNMSGMYRLTANELRRRYIDNIVNHDLIRAKHLSTNKKSGNRIAKLASSALEMDADNAFATFLYAKYAFSGTGQKSRAILNDLNDKIYDHEETLLMHTKELARVRAFGKVARLGLNHPALRYAPVAFLVLVRDAAEALGKSTLQKSCQSFLEKHPLATTQATDSITQFITEDTDYVEVERNQLW